MVKIRPEAAFPNLPDLFFVEISSRMKAPWLSFVMGAFLSLFSSFILFFRAGKKREERKKEKSPEADLWAWRE
jgi:hypothetical protein